MKFFLRTLLLLISYGLLLGCTSSKKRFIIGVSQCSQDNWRTQMNNELLRESTFYGDIQLIFKTAHDDNHKQIAQIDSFIKQQVDLIIVAPNESIPITPIVEKAYQKGIPVVVVDRKTASDNYTAYIGADNFEIGKSAGQYIANKLQNRGYVIELGGLKGTSAAIDRHLGFISALAKHPAIHLVSSTYLNWEKDTARIATQALLAKFPKTNVIFAHNDRIAYGAYLATVEAPKANRIKIVGIDALPGKGEGIDLISKGFIDASILYPTGGDLIMKTVHEIVTNKAFDKNTLLSTAIITKANARIAKLQMQQITKLDNRIETLNVRLINHQQKNSIQRYLLIVSFGASIMILVFLFIEIRSLRIKNVMNQKLKTSNEEILNQKDLLEKQRDKLIGLSKQLEEATQAKLVFFTNISHEFCTPLTLIADPINSLITHTDMSQQQQLSLLKMVQRNINILLRLVSQILDFRRYENGKTQLNLSTINLMDTIKAWNTDFRVIMENKGFFLKFTAESDVDYQLAIDLNKIERIYYNLLSNALKYTQTNGTKTIDVHLFTKIIEDKNYLGFRVKNRNTEINAEYIKNVFNRFYKVKDTSSGAGIGLALAKAYAEMHGGSITATYTKDQYVIFTVLLPIHKTKIQKDMASAEQEGLAIEPYIKPSIEAEETLFNPLETLPLSEEFDHPLLLIVEDNKEVRHYLSFLLHDTYKILVASDGNEGFKTAIRYIPDLIVTDIMMPVMDGIEMCNKLKTELITCHIPILMLTACALDKKRIEGFSNGADAYISKPFSSELLLVRIKNLIENRLRLQKNKPQNIPLRENNTPQEQTFIDKFKALIEQNFTDSQFNVEDMSRAMGLSRIQLYRKIKAITTLNPNKILRDTRLKKGDLLLRSSDRSIAEIAYDIGFSAPSYFSKCYKEHFGISPTEIKNKINQK